MAQLRYFDDQDVLHVRPLGPEKFIIGRVESCQIPITDDLASREHSRLDREPDGRYRVRDLGSRNHTYVNGEQINETLLTHGDMIRVGNHVFEFLDDTFDPSPLELSFLTPDRNEPAGTEWIKMKTPVAVVPSRLADLALLAAEAPYPARAEDVASSAIGRLLHVFKADRGFIALKGAGKRELKPVAHRGLTPAAGTSLKPVSETFVMSALLQTVAGRYPQSASQVEPQSGYAATALVAPIMHQARAAGVIYVDRPAGTNPFTPQNLHEMAAAAAQVGELMTQASKRLAENVSALGAPWLASFRRLQQAAATPIESNASFDIALRTLPGQLRCGDACDVIHVNQTRTDLLLLDYGGQGVAGLAMAQGIRTAVRTALALEGDAPDIERVVSAVNRAMPATNARQLVTCLLLSIDIDRGRVTYVNAGQPAPLLMAGAKRLVTLDHPALLLGIDANYNYTASVADLPAKFRVVCHTDGLPEAANAAGETLGSQRIHDLLLDERSFATAATVADAVMNALDHHRSGKALGDDATLIVLAHG